MQRLTRRRVVRRRLHRLRGAAALLLCATLALAPKVAPAAGSAWVIAGGDAKRGSKLIQEFGCAACHSVPGVENAHGNVGPPLARFGDRTFIAGMLSNTPANLMRWLRDPQGVVPGNAMPDMGVSESQARDIAAYLYTLR